MIAASHLMADDGLRVNLALLLSKIAVDGVRPHLHGARVHLQLARFLKLECNSSMCEFAPSFCLSDPLPLVFRLGLSASQAPQFHFAAIINLAHWCTSWL